ncbi:class I SAM-dependent methyltransferase [Larkinella bovis]|uniref:Class I SAM-dependent methyltransferase n=1 Tax=Larkinella bovis TaxID=683041 RepID=A0ABW0IIG3_9BACT
MSSKEFYDNWAEKLLLDYLNGNNRIESAIKKVVTKIPVEVKEILDIGCGIGWSSFELSNAFKAANITGIDLSSELIKTANQIFNNDRLEYLNLDITKTREITSKKFDFIILIDVFEHIPKTERTNFIELLNRLLTLDGAIFFSCPTIYHQNYLRNNNPSGLQPIDEDVSLSDFLWLAKLINGNVVYFEHVNIWNTNDYQYCLIEKTSPYKKPINKLNNWKTQSIEDRIKNIRKSAGGELIIEKFNIANNINKTSRANSVLKRFIGLLTSRYA